MASNPIKQEVNVSASVLNGNVRIIYDSYGVPHIYASDPFDMYFGQGYAVARDRLWQLEFYRHVAEGRISELIGEAGVQIDEFIRKLNMRPAVYQIWKSMSPRMKRYLIAYAGGVSCYMSNPVDGLPKEFKELNHKPSHWKPTDSVHISRMMAFILGAMPMADKLLHMMDLTRFTPAQMDDFKKGREAPDAVTAINFNAKSKAGKAKKSSTSKKVSLKEELAEFASKFYADLMSAIGLLAGPELIPASNNWVIAPKKSKSGSAFMANDPHLAYWHPSMVFEIHLNCPGVNVVGATSAGYIDVMIGHNERIAWGITTCQYDVMDIYLEKLKPGNPDRYLTLKGTYLAFKKRKEVIKIKTPKGMKTKTVVVRSTSHGPVIWDNIAGNAVTFKWTGHKPSNEQLAFHLVSRAKNVKEFRDALKHYKVGCMNFVYADVDGNIFWMTPADVPIRKLNGLMPMDGASGKHEWEGFVPFDELPSLLNPVEGFIATANNRPVPKEYKHYLAERFDAGYRQKRISELIKSKKKLSFDDVRAIQNDNFQYFGKMMTPDLIKAADAKKKQLTDLSRKALEYLKGWNYMTDVDSVGSTAFHYWLRAALKNVIDFKKPSLGQAPSSGAGNAELSASMFDQLDSIDFQAGGAYSVFVARLLQGEKMKYPWLEKKGLTLEEWVVNSLNDATKELKKLLGSNVDKWSWGKLHKLTLKHLAIGEYDHGEFPMDGSFSTVRNATYSILGGKRAPIVGGTVMVMLCELKGKVQRATNVIAGGQRYIHGDPHYDDQLKLFLKGEVRPMLSKKEDVMADARKIIDCVRTGYGWRKRRVKRKS